MESQQGVQVKKLQLKIHELFWQLNAWIDDHIPFICANCNRVRFRKDMIIVRHRTAGLVRLCKECYEQIYNPWSEDNE